MKKSRYRRLAGAAMIGLAAASSLLAGCAGAPAAAQPAPTPAKSEGALLVDLRTKNAALRELRAKDWSATDWAAVLDLANEILAMDPEAVDALWSKADAYDYFERWNDALKTWLRYIELRPGRGDAYAHAAMEYERLGDRDKARGHFAKSVELDPGNWWNWEIYANYLTWTERDYARAVEAYDRSFGLHLDGDINGWAYRNRAQALQGLGRRSEAAADLRRMLEAGRKYGDQNMVREAERLLAANGS